MTRASASGPPASLYSDYAPAKSQGAGPEIVSGRGIARGVLGGPGATRGAAGRPVCRRTLRPCGWRNPRRTREPPSASVTQIRRSSQVRFPPWKRQFRIPPGRLREGQKRRQITLRPDLARCLHSPCPILGGSQWQSKWPESPPGGEIRCRTTRCGLPCHDDRGPVGVEAGLPSAASHDHFRLPGQTTTKRRPSLRARRRRTAFATDGYSSLKHPA